jgi:hypothetical protein
MWHRSTHPAEAKRRKRRSIRPDRLAPERAPLQDRSDLQLSVERLTACRGPAGYSTPAHNQQGCHPSPVVR